MRVIPNTGFKIQACPNLKAGQSDGLNNNSSGKTSISFIKSQKMKIADLKA